MPALIAGWEMADKAGAPLIWMHGNQPYVFQSSEALLQRMQRRPEVKVASLQLMRGPNRVVQALDGFIRAAVIQAGDLNAIRDAMASPPLQFRRRELTQDEPSPATTTKASSHMTRLWAIDQVREWLKAGRQSQSIALATAYQLVTPVTGAVVLETAQQYAANNLQPADAGSTPGIPEPSTLLLLLGPAGYILTRRPGRRRKAA